MGFEIDRQSVDKNCLQTFYSDGEENGNQSLSKVKVKANFLKLIAQKLSP